MNRRDVFDARTAVVTLARDHRSPWSAQRRLSTRRLAFAISTVVIGGCSGDARPLLEAVEAGDLDLVGIEIVPPSERLDPLVLSSDESVDFELIGVQADGTRVELEDDDRRWRVSDRSVASINAAGVLVARAQGSVQVGVSLADLDATGFPVTVSNAELVSVERIRGDASVDPCLTERYSAVGGFADGSERLLTDAAWSAGSPDTTRLDVDSDGVLELVATTPGALELTVSSGTVSAVQSLTVTSALTEMSITPSPIAVEEGETVQLAATGSYSDVASDTDTGDASVDMLADPEDEAETTGDDTPATGDDEIDASTLDDAAAGTRTETITDTVDWSVVAGTANASVGNRADSRGLLAGEAAGVATVQASCGPVQTQRDAIVSAATGSSDGLAFEDDEITIRIGEIVTLSVSRGDEFDEDAIVTGIDYSVEGPVGVVELLDDNTGQIEGIGTGSVTVVARDGNDSARIEVEVR